MQSHFRATASKSWLGDQGCNGGVDRFSKLRSKVGASNSDANEESEAVRCTIWQAPLAPYLKLNVDAVWLSNSGQTGIGIIIRNHLGELKGGKMCRTTAMSAVDAEARAVMVGLSFAADQGYSHIWVESDSKLLIKCHHLNHACKVFDESSHRDVVSYNAMLDAFVKAGEVSRARQLFDEMPVRDSVSWGTVLVGYAQMNQCEEAIQLFDQMLGLRVIPDDICLVSALSACAQLGDLERGKNIHDYIKRNRVRLSSYFLTALVDLYAKCGCIKTALEIFEASPDKNVFTWNAMLVGLAMHGHGKLSLNYFCRMIEAGVKPDGVSVLGVLVGCSHVGFVHQAQKLFDDMETVYGVPRELKHYGCMADLLGRAGLIKEAMEMIDKMPMGGDVFVWGGLLGGCRIHGDVEMAKKAAEHVMELDPEDGGVYSIMANVYANAEKWDDVVKIRKSIKDAKRVKKISGCSLINLNGSIHKFIAGDSLHPQSEAIYWVLDGLWKHQFEA